MGNLKYDPSRFEEMDSFIKKMRSIAEAYYKKHGKGIDWDTTYDQLCDYGLRKTDFDFRRPKNISALFDMWIDRYDSHSNMWAHVEPSFDHFCLFESSNLLRYGKFIKMYVPIDYKHLYKGANILFDYIESLDVKHQSKIARILRSDNVVIRLEEEKFEEAKKIIEFINNNDYIKEGLNPVNPFLPTIDNVGIMHDSGGSYNSDIAELITEYVNKMIYENKPASLASFSDWVYKNAHDYVNINSEQDLFDTFNIVMTNNPTVELDKKSKEEPNAKDSDAKVVTAKLERKKVAVFLEALKATYVKYGFDQASCAIEEAIKNNDYTFFTNGTDKTINFRERLIANVNQSEMLDIIHTTLGLSGVEIPQDVKDLSEVYTNLLFKDVIAFKLDEICRVTLDNYNQNQVSAALKNYINYENPNYFSRFISKDRQDVNYRDELMKMSKVTVISAMTTSLNNRGIDTSQMSTDEKISVYSETLAKEKQSDVSRTSSIMK